MNTKTMFVRKYETPVLEVREKDGVVFLTFPLLEQTGLVHHAFATKLGGVSEGLLGSMNFSYKKGDDPAHVRENLRRMVTAIGEDPDRLVMSQQTHTTNVRIVTEEDAGKGYHRPLDYEDVDGLVTNVPGITLVTTYADCVPLYFLDPVHHAIGLSHSGWRGTVGHIGKKTLELMQQAYHTDPADVLACIGPSICQDCYEVSEEVVEEFSRQFPKELHEQLFYRKENGKYQLHLWNANKAVLQMAGVRPKNIQVTDICTRCNAELLHSHRAGNGKQGILSAFLALRP